MLPGGYISYVQPDHSWRQILWVDPNKPPQYNSLGDASNVRSLRLHIHRAMGADLDKAKHAQRRKPDGLGSEVLSRIAIYKEARLAPDRERHLSE